jgi:hypothetical protein
MPRKRSDRIEESIEIILALEKRYRGRAQETRLKMLRLLKEDPARTLNDVGSMIGCSERSVHRWLKEYQMVGLNKMLEQCGAEEQRLRIGPQELEELRSKLRSGGIGTLNEIQGWLKDEFGVEYSLKAISNLLQHRLKARRVWVIP